MARWRNDEMDLKIRAKVIRYYRSTEISICCRTYSVDYTSVPRGQLKDGGLFSCVAAWISKKLCASIKCQARLLAGNHSRPQRPRSFWSAPRIATSGRVQQRKSAIHGLPVPLRMLWVKSDKSDWFWSQSIVFTNPFNTGMSLDRARGRDSWCWPKGARPLGTRMDIRDTRHTPISSPEPSLPLSCGTGKRSHGFEQYSVLLVHQVTT